MGNALTLKGTVAGRIFNEKRTAKSGVKWSNDYLIIKSDPWETKKHEIKCNFYSIKIYASNTTTNFLGTVQNGDIIECSVTLDCVRDENFEYQTRSNVWGDEGIAEKSPQIWTTLSLDTYKDEPIRIIQAFQKEDIEKHNEYVGKGLGGNPEDDLPF
jgi:hypothetical protein